MTKGSGKIKVKSGRIAAQAPDGKKQGPSADHAGNDECLGPDAFAQGGPPFVPGSEVRALAPPNDRP